MKKIKASEIVKITYNTPWDKHTEWIGYIRIKARRVNPANATNNDWEPLKRYKDYCLVTSVNGEKADFFIKDDKIMHQCWEEPRLYGGWGYVEPAAGGGLSCLDIGPDFIVKDAPDFFLEEDPDFYEEISDRTMYLTKR